MHLLGAILSVAAVIPCVVGQTPASKGNPNTQWLAQLPNTKSTTGTVLIGQGPGGDGMSVQVALSGLPSEGGPFRQLHQSSRMFRTDSAL